MKRKKAKTDRVLRVSSSESVESDYSNKSSGLSDQIVVSGSMDLGQKGNPVTIFIEDEVTGETLEINGVREAFLIIEDNRKNTSGWLAIAIGRLERLSSVIEFLSKTTLESLRRIVGLP